MTFPRRAAALREAGRALAVLAFAALLAAAPQRLAAQPSDGRIAPDSAAAAAPAGAEAMRAEADAMFAEWEAAAQRAEAAVADPEFSTPALEVLRESLAGQRAAARTLADRTEQALGPLRAQLEALGPAPETEGVPADEPSGVAEQRRALEERIARLDAGKRKAELAATRADTLINEIDVEVRSRFADQLATLGPTPANPVLWPEAVAEAVGVAERLFDETVYALRDPVRQAERMTRLPLLAAGIAAAIFLAFWVRIRAVTAIQARIGEQSTAGQRIGATALAAVVRFVVPVVGLGIFVVAARSSQLLGPLGSKLLDATAMGLALWIGARGIAAAFYAPDAPRLRLTSQDDVAASRAANWAIALGGVLFAYMAFVRGGEAAGLSAGTLAIYNAVIIALGAVALWALSNRVRPAKVAEPEPGDETVPAPDAAEPDGSALGRRLASGAALAMKVAAVAAVLLSQAGYYAASQYVFYPTAMTLGLVAVGVLLFLLIDGAIEAYVDGRAEGGEGLRLLPVAAGFVIGLAAIPLLALIWGARPADLREAWSLIVGGFSVGGVHLSPISVLTFFIVFGIVYTVTRLLQAVLATSVLPKTKMDQGGRTAVTSGLGYVGFAIAAIAGISAAGLDLSSLAIVAGALSVGIGFGLQAIVSNFVSGVILLVERPIKVGDWIEVGGTHGTVRRVSVRATEIETFDRSTLILPNSDLISGRVTNYTLDNRLGRVIIKVGVAYGSDVRKVEKILREISNAERRALSYPAPQVLFMGFGADSLDFEVRMILRDVSNILSVTSDTHFAIDKRFREEGIEIPFAQRVVHLAEPERLAALLRGTPPGADDAPGSVSGAAPEGGPAPDALPAARGQSTA